MRRDISALASSDYDLVIVGGGIVGLCAAWDAAQRGLSVALVERGDFAQASSANCFKMIHGGIRYLQHADLLRLRESSAERRVLLRIAPHLARPLPILMPTYGHGLKGRELLFVGMKVYDLLTADRNRGIGDPARRIPSTRSLSPRAVRELFPALGSDGLTGGAIFHDGQMYSPARLALAFLLSAAEHGANAANYAEATRFLRDGDRVVGVAVRDTLTDARFELRGRVVLNATGGWAPDLLADHELGTRPTFSRDACFVVRRALSPHTALAVPTRTRDPDAILSRSARHLFLAPWRGCTLVGVWHRVIDGDPAGPGIGEAELRSWIDEIGAALPGWPLSLDDVALTHGGPVLFGENRPGAVDLSYGKRPLLADHGAAGAEGLLTLIGIRYTTARADAARAVDLVLRKLGRRAPACATGTTRLQGGDVDHFEDWARGVQAERGSIGSDALHALLCNHGSQYRRVLDLAKGDRELLEPVPGSATLRAEVIHAVRREMARKLADVVFRRTDLGTAGWPGTEALEVTADLMAAELGWEPPRRRKELEETRTAFPAL